MIYPYFCKNCDHTFEVVKSVSEIGREETCERCGSRTSDRRIGLPRLAPIDIEPYFHYGLGKQIRSKRDLKGALSELRDQGKNIIEIGDEAPEKIEKKMSKERAEKREKRWSEPVEKLANDVLHGR